ncbi:hypothetical protein Rumeso_01978 [Rubellimicrobium mesophilum DSM 19309]|uniref:Uncharacterized protein n=1 Tax=Rubellimicrobium mesophilum DSM 19309 TaxID=442562 RepID=A0A017HQ23_9RHOB|nr:hypothetical protein [Rubellimicrobium mesophilum]EYD76420.1 hypothetical protein Rumeso_01978 [Rubellimicrobium mesophilum DSM 19309]
MDEDDVIEVISENVSGQTKSAAGNAGDDEVRSSIQADGEVAGQDVVANGNSHAVTGGAGQDIVEIATGSYGYGVYGGGHFGAQASGNASFAAGGEGDDTLSSLIGALAYDGDAAVTGNAHTLAADAGQDFIGAHIGASALFGASGVASGNSSVADGGDGDDQFDISLSAVALYITDSVASTATTTGNSMVNRGGEGDDTLLLDVLSSASSSGIAHLTDNVVKLEGNAGADVLRVTVTEEVRNGGPGTATMDGNSFILHGGAGDDQVEVLRYSAGLDGFTATLTGGRGHDVASLTYSSLTEDDLVLDFSRSYDRDLADGTTLRGFEAVRIEAGQGDDLFRGGLGDDGFSGGLGSDQANGGAGDDALVADTVLYAYGPDDDDTRSGDSDAFLGGKGDDALTATVAANASFASTAVTRDNILSMAGGNGWDEASIAVSAFAGSSFEGDLADATTRGNTVSATGDNGDDRLGARMSADSEYDGVASVTGNAVTLAGGKGDDHLAVELSTSVQDDGAATLTGNVIALLGGKGDDDLRVSGNALAGNSLTLDGGRGHDSLAFEGDRGDYRVTATGEGDYEVTDLSDGSPGAVYAVLDVETLVFNGTVFDLA